jgi:hypothetical protein
MYLAGSEHPIHMLSRDLKIGTGSLTAACEQKDAVAAKLRRAKVNISSEISRY